VTNFNCLQASAECSTDVKAESDGETKPGEASAASDRPDAPSDAKTDDAAKDDTGTCKQETATASTDTSQHAVA